MKKGRAIVSWAEFLIKILLITLMALGSLTLMIKIAFNLIKVITK